MPRARTEKTDEPEEAEDTVSPSFEMRESESPVPAQVSRCHLCSPGAPGVSRLLLLQNESDHSLFPACLTRQGEARTKRDSVRKSALLSPRRLVVIVVVCEEENRKPHASLLLPTCISDIEGWAPTLGHHARRKPFAKGFPLTHLCFLRGDEKRMRQSYWLPDGVCRDERWLHLCSR